MDNLDTELTDSVILPVDDKPCSDLVDGNPAQLNEVVNTADDTDIKDTSTYVNDHSCIVTGQVENKSDVNVEDVLVNSVESVNKETVDAGAEQVHSKALDKEEINVPNDVDLPEEVVIFAKACFGNCPFDHLSQDDMESLTRFITSKDHLKKNIAKIQFDRVYFEGRNERGTYEHLVNVRMSVLRRNLWQGARAYIWKHLGSDVWERGNGTTIELSRIHQK